MKTKLIGALAGALLLVAAPAHAIELVKNGGFETAGTEEASALYWSRPDLGLDAQNFPYNQARTGNWVSQVGTDPYGTAYAPHGANNGTGTQIPTRTTWLGGLNPRTCIIQQSIDTTGLAGGSASLSFKLVTEDGDVAGHDFLYVDFGANRVKSFDLGAYWVNWVNQFGVVRQGGPHFWTLETPMIDLSPYLDGTTKNLTFTVVNDASSTYGSSSAWIDNVSIQAQAVPEPTTIVALGLGAVAFLRRRLKA